MCGGACKKTPEQKTYEMAAEKLRYGIGEVLWEEIKEKHGESVTLEAKLAPVLGSDDQTLGSFQGDISLNGDDIIGIVYHVDHKDYHVFAQNEDYTESAQRLSDVLNEYDPRFEVKSCGGGSCKKKCGKC